jgi:hypothetical protein
LIFLSHDFIRLGLTRAKALQTVSRFPRETRRRYASLKSNASILFAFEKTLDIKKSILYLLQGRLYNKENKWCIIDQAIIIFIIGIFLIPVCLGCADTRTTCKAKKPWVDEKTHGFFISKGCGEKSVAAFFCLKGGIHHDVFRQKNPDRADTEQGYRKDGNCSNGSRHFHGSHRRS